MNLCGQDDVAPGECPNCGGSINTERLGGFQCDNWRYCSEDCIAESQEFVERQNRERHLYLRDMLCGCEICTEAGFPTESEKEQYAEHLRLTR